MTNPMNAVTVTPDQHVRIVNGKGHRCIEPDVETTISKSDAFQCSEQKVLEHPSCPDEKWSGSLPAGEVLKFETLADRRAVCIKPCGGCLKLAVGTPDNPLAIPEEGLVKDNAPCLIEDGEELTVSLSEVNAMALINCTDSTVSYEIIWKGC